MDKAQLKKHVEMQKQHLSDYKRIVTAVEMELAAFEAALQDGLTKPLRHGDYGVDGDGPFFLWENTYLWTKEYERTNNRCLSRSLNKKGNNSQLRVWASQILGNIFDDLTELAKPLLSFQADVHTYSFDFLNLPQTPIQVAGNWHTEKEAEEISMKIQRVIYTAKQAKAKNES